MNRGADLAIGFGIVAIAGIWWAVASAKSDVATTKASKSKRVADAIATQDPRVMRRVAAEMDQEGSPDLAESLRMAADLADRVQQTPQIFQEMQA